MGIAPPCFDYWLRYPEPKNPNPNPNPHNPNSNPLNQNPNPNSNPNPNLNPKQGVHPAAESLWRSDPAAAHAVAKVSDSSRYTPNRKTYLKPNPQT